MIRQAVQVRYLQTQKAQLLSTVNSLWLFAHTYEVEYLKHIIEGLVDYPEQVQIEETVDEMGVLLTLTVAREDMGKIIGKKGATANTIRELLRVFGLKHRRRLSVKINEPNEDFSNQEL